MQNGNKKNSIQEDLDVIDKSFRGELLVNILYLESKIKQLLDHIFKKQKASKTQIINILKLKKKYYIDDFVKKNKKSYQKDLNYLEKRFKTYHKKYPKTNVFDVIYFHEAVLLIKMIRVDKYISYQNIKTISRSELKEKINLIPDIKNMRNTLSHPPRNPEIKFDEFINMSQVYSIHKVKYFNSKADVLSSIEIVDEYFRKIIEQLKDKS